MVKVGRSRTRKSATIWPPALRPHDVIAVVAPAGPVDKDEFWRGMAWLRGRYRLRVSSAIFSRAGYLAGDDARRGGELARAMVDPEARAILAARGGYGTMRVMEGLPWDALAKAPKWLLGFSDVTALHACAWARGIASVHGPSVRSFATASVGERAAWLAAVERPTAVRVWRGLRVVHAGPLAKGPIVGGNLALLEAMAAAGRLVVPAGAVLALEDVTERPYRVDRMLTALAAGGHLARASAIVLGAFTQCDAGDDGVTVDEVLSERTKALGIPVLAGAPFGHAAPNEAFVLGATAEVTGDRVTMSP
jgi:muramoyltetrapeptide carboxypeptidase